MIFVKYKYNSLYNETFEYDSFERLFACCRERHSYRYDSIIFLDCSHNQLHELPTLPDELIELDCSHNQLDDLPTMPRELITLNCSYNKFHDLPHLNDNLEILYFHVLI
jgi:Leucine-rich repeat (LRR) protein